MQQHLRFVSAFLHAGCKVSNSVNILNMYFTERYTEEAEFIVLNIIGLFVMLTVIGLFVNFSSIPFVD